jgi:hypothetical protein
LADFWAKHLAIVWSFDAVYVHMYVTTNIGKYVLKVHKHVGIGNLGRDIRYNITSTYKSCQQFCPKVCTISQTWVKTSTPRNFASVSQLGENYLRQSGALEALCK